MFLLRSSEGPSDILRGQTCQTAGWEHWAGAAGRGWQQRYEAAGGEPANYHQDAGISQISVTVSDIITKL